MNASRLEKGFADDRVRPSLENNGVSPNARHQISFLDPFRPLLERALRLRFCNLDIAELRNALTFASDL